MSQEGLEVVWTLLPDGALRWQIEHQHMWLAFGDIDVRGHWRLQGDRLTLELAETPAGLALLGADWAGQTSTLQIDKLTNEELSFADTDLHFRRSHASPKSNEP